MVTDRLPAVLRRAATVLVNVLMLTISAFMAYYGAKLCIETWHQNIGEIPWMPVGATYLPVPLGGAITFLFTLEHILLGHQATRAVVTFDHEKLDLGEI